MKSPIQWLKLNIKHKNKETDVFIPDTGDRGETEYLIQAETEKTIKQLEKAPDRPKSKMSKEDIGGALREYNEFLKRKRGDVNKRYF